MTTQEKTRQDTVIDAEVEQAPFPRASAQPRQERIIPCGNLAAALATAQQKCRSVAHDRQNSYHKYAYSSSEALIEAAKSALAETGLSLLPIEQTVNGHDREGPDRFELSRKFLLLHSSGESMPITVNWPICPEKGRPLDKATATAATLSLAYLLRDMLLMPRVDPEDEVAGRDDRQKPEPQQPRQNPAGPKKAEKRPPPTTPKELAERLNQADLRSEQQGITGPGYFTALAEQYGVENEWGNDFDRWNREQIAEAWSFIVTEARAVKAAHDADKQQEQPA